LIIEFIGTYFTITANYNSSDIELLLNDVCPTNLSELNAQINSLLYTTCNPNISHHVEELIPSVIRFVFMGMSLLIFISAGTGASKLLSSKITSASAALPALK
jgi:hypothetical protein